MTYEYICNNCKTTELITKPINEASRIEKCKCGKEMKRVYDVSSIRTGDGIKITMKDNNGK